MKKVIYNLFGSERGLSSAGILISIAVILVVAGATIAAIQINRAGQKTVAVGNLGQLADLPVGQTSPSPLAVSSPETNAGATGATSSPLSDAQKQAIMDSIKQAQDKIQQQEQALGKNLVTIFAKNYEFSKTEIQVKQGDKVKIIFASLEGTHNWGIDEYNIRTKDVSKGQGVSVEFTADKAGTFQYYSSVGDDRANGMVGTLVVEPAK